jgi:glycolate oxidase FAD binding subunit
VTAAAPPVTDQVRDRVRDAIAARTPLRIAGAGTWLHAGRPVRADRRLEIAESAGILEYTPGDLTLTALAGTTLDEIARVTRAEGQWLTLDPAGSGAGTLGATFATGSAGPLAHAFGLPRDHALGLTLVTGRGDVVRAGGRVVKNVAGFDLTRLAVGAWGTLGAITELSVRLRAVPEIDVTIAVAMPDGPDGGPLAERLALVRQAPLRALAVELLNAPLARATGAGDGQLLLVRLGGNEPLVRAQRDTLERLGDSREVPPAVWASLRAAEPAGSAVVRLSARASRLAGLWGVAREAGDAGSGALCHASVGRGVVRAIFPAPRQDALASLLSRPMPSTLICESLPAPLWDSLAPGTAGDRLSTGIRDAFDPDHLMNPGVFGEPAA